MVGDDIAYFDVEDWDMDARLNLDLMGVEYRQLLEGLGVEVGRFRAALHSQ